jgi:pantetheine-phosphate adenylyltransferase
MRKAVYPGSFDPITYGHLDLITRGARIFDDLVVSVAVSREKEHLFSVPERVAMLKELTKSLKNVTVDSFTGLAVDHVRRHKTSVILRGIRTMSDFEYEFQMALTNRKVATDIETVFAMSDERYSFIRSSLIKEVAALGGSLANMVPPLVEEALRKKLRTPPR